MTNSGNVVRLHDALNMIRTAGSLVRSSHCKYLTMQAQNCHLKRKSLVSAEALAWQRIDLEKRATNTIAGNAMVYFIARLSHYDVTCAQKKLCTEFVTYI